MFACSEKCLCSYFKPKEDARVPNVLTLESNTYPVQVHKTAVSFVLFIKRSVCFLVRRPDLLIKILLSWGCGSAGGFGMFISFLRTLADLILQCTEVLKPLRCKHSSITATGKPIKLLQPEFAHRMLNGSLSLIAVLIEAKDPSVFSATHLTYL